jgi:choice-of-anchor B domain-containing protein
MKNTLYGLLSLVVLSLSVPSYAQNFNNYNMTLRSTLDYPGQTLANICGYASGGHEYALVGASKGLSIVDVTNPDAPVQIIQIPGPDNLWKEIKTYKHYAYVTSEGGQGMQIVDLTNLPGTNLTYHSYKGDGSINGQLNTIHALHIDTLKGYLYIYGSNLFNGGAVVCNLNADPYNPVYAGQFSSLGYVHDGYAWNDTLYAGHINNGYMSIVDFTNKANPKVLGTVSTPSKFTHNTWLLSDHKHILTTDEKIPSYVTSYDISDPTDIKELSRISTNDGFGSIGHNVQVQNDWSITSWYEDGVAIIDAHKPDNLVVVGQYDTYDLAGPAEDGCWGVFPFLPSGNLVVSNIPTTNSGAVGKMFVLTPTYVRACYLEGTITDGCTNQPMIGATIHIVNGNANAGTTSQNDGSYKTGNAAPGNFTVTISKTGYQPQTIPVVFTPGVVTPLNVTLSVFNAIDVTGTFKDGLTQLPVANTNLHLEGQGQSYKVLTDANGKFSLSCVPAGDYKVGAWGFLNATVTLSNSGATTISLQRGYYDDFAIDLGWSASGNASTGEWVRDVPIGTTYNNALVNPDADVPTDDNDKCYMTGNGGGNPGDDDVDNGSVTLTSPNMKLAGFQDAILTFYYWFYNGGGTAGVAPNDSLIVYLSNGLQTVPILEVSTSESAWRYSGNISLKNFLPLTDHMSVSFKALDQAPGNLVEAAVDVFQITPIVLGTQSALDQTPSFAVSPNPSGSEFNLRYDWQEAGDLRLEVTNVLGQVVLSRSLNTGSGVIACGQNWAKGTYFAVLRGSNAQRMPVKLIRQ